MLESSQNLLRIQDLLEPGVYSVNKLSPGWLERVRVCPEIHSEVLTLQSHVIHIGFTLPSTTELE